MNIGNNNAKLDNIWNETNNEEFGKIIARKQVIGKNAILAPFTPQL